MAEFCCDLQVHINGQQTFLLSQKVMSAYSGRLKKMIRRERKISSQMDFISISFEGFPGGAHGFEQVSQFCYNNGTASISIQNVSTLYCAAVYLGMTDKLCSCNLLKQAETFLEGMFYWCWNDVLVCLSTCDPYFSYADSCGLIDKLITTLLAKIAQNSDLLFSLSSNSSSSSSPDNANNSGRTNNSSNASNTKAWWFDDLATLSPMIIEKVIRNLGAYGSDNNSLMLTKFLLHYLKIKNNCPTYPKTDYCGLADTAVYGVILMGKTAFTCRALFWVLRLVSAYGLSKVCRSGLEKLIGSMLDLAKLDDLLVSGNSSGAVDDGTDYGGVYDVNHVVRLIRVFVQCEGISLQRLKKVGWLVDQYLAEISPDQNLKISKFVGVAQSLPDSARDSFDGVYRAIDIYLQSHTTLSFEERSRLCQCLNYEKLSLEACKDLAKNPRIPPRVAVQALASQKSVNYEDSATKKDHTSNLNDYCESPKKKKTANKKQLVVYGSKGVAATNDHYEEECQEERRSMRSSSFSEGSEDMKLNIQRMQWRVLELEKLCKEMKGQMTTLVRHNSKSNSSTTHNRPPRLC